VTTVQPLQSLGYNTSVIRRLKKLMRATVLGDHATLSFFTRRITATHCCAIHSPIGSRV
jgi:hypothetical protein